MQVSFYPNTYSKNATIANSVDIMKGILLGTWANEIAHARSLPKDSEEYKNAKNMLPAVTWSGTFKAQTRLKDSLVSYSNLVVMDIDKIDDAKIALLKQQLSADEHVMCVFISPSGNGIKILVKVNSGPENHLAAFLHLQKYFEDTYFVKVDKSGKDECRLCYVSYDPATIIREDSKIFEVDLKYGEVAKTSLEVHVTAEGSAKIFSVCRGWVEKKFTFIEGERNMYIHALSCALNRCGVPVPETIMLITQNYVTPDIKWHQSVKSAYFHNQHEHGVVKLKDISTHAFIAPPYVANYTDDVVTNDLMRITATLYHHKVSNADIFDVVEKVAKYYNIAGFIDVNRNTLAELMNKAISVLMTEMANHAAQSALKYETAESLGRELISQNASGSLPTYIRDIDEALGGGLMASNFYGLIGFGGTFKSVVVQFWTYMHAMNDVPVLYLNGEMSKLQFYERLALQVFGINLRSEMAKGNINPETIDSFIEQMETITKKNIFFFNGSGFNKQSINATLDHIFVTTGKKVRLVIMDGLTQMDQGGREEAAANIHNSGVCKEIVKEAHGGEGVILVSLIHCSGEENKTLRNTGSKVRGGSKMLANMDGYFCTSLLVDPETGSLENADDIIFRSGKFYFRLVDKRSIAGTVSAIMNVTPRLLLEMEECDPKQYEFNPNKR